MAIIINNFQKIIFSFYILLFKLNFVVQFNNYKYYKYILDVCLFVLLCFYIEFFLKQFI